MVEQNLLLQRDLTFDGSGSTESSTMISTVTTTNETVITSSYSSVSLISTATDYTVSTVTDYTSVITTSTVDFTLSPVDSTSVITAHTDPTSRISSMSDFSFTADIFEQTSQSGSSTEYPSSFSDKPSTISVPAVSEETSIFQMSISSTTPTIITTTMISSISTASITIVDTTITLDPNTCKNSSHILVNSSCETKDYIKNKTAAILNGNLTGINDINLANTLLLHINSITYGNVEAHNNTLPPKQVDEIVGSLNSNLSISTTESFIMAQQINQRGNLSVLGASFRRDNGGEIVNNAIHHMNDSSISVEATVSDSSLAALRSLNILIIDKPIAYEKLDNRTDTKLASSVIVLTVQRNASISNSTNVLLSFKVLEEYRPNYNPSYSCAYLDTTTLQWNSAPCTAPHYNSSYDRHECSCDHLSIYALVWTRNTLSCNAATEILESNGTCTPKENAQREAAGILNGNSTNSTVIADALSRYIRAVTDSDETFDPNYTVLLDTIDESLAKINNFNSFINTNESFLMAQSPKQSNGTIVLGASFRTGIGGEVINNKNKDDVNNQNVSAAAIIRNESLADVTSLNMLIIARPSAFRDIDNITNKTLASSIIVIATNRNSTDPINVSLIFKVTEGWGPNISNPVYLCSFYDTNNLQWNESGCTRPIFNAQLTRHECSCNHTTSFALLWLPDVPHTRDFSAQDIASLVFQSISIVCFICIIIHALVIRLLDPLMSLRSFDLLPLISCASTTILFIFYIALGMTVYTRTSADDEKQCFLSSKVLMFFVYFFILFMFCVKTSVGYFNYLRFVRLFPEPARGKLFILLVTLFFVSIIWVAFAAGFDSNSSYNITELIPYKICWFSRGVIHYFFTIPVCIFLAINLILFTLVARRIIIHVQNATSPHQSYERMKRCVIVLLASCVTQGIGWIVGPPITVAKRELAEALGWLFVVFNGLEGVWAIMLYAIIRSQHLDEQKRLVAVKELAKSTALPSLKRKKSRVDDTNSSITRRYPTTSKYSDKERNSFNDLYSVESDDRSSSTC